MSADKKKIRVKYSFFNYLSYKFHQNPTLMNVSLLEIFFFKIVAFVLFYR